MSTLDEELTAALDAFRAGSLAMDRAADLLQAAIDADRFAVPTRERIKLLLYIAGLSHANSAQASYTANVLTLLGQEHHGQAWLDALASLGEEIKDEHREHCGCDECRRARGARDAAVARATEIAAAEGGAAR